MCISPLKSGHLSNQDTPSRSYQCPHLGVKLYFIILFSVCLQDETIPLLASFLRKNHRDLRLATLYCLDAIFQGYSQYTLISPGSGSQTMSSVTATLYKAVLEELPVLICDNDLHISQLVLTLLCTIMDVNPECIPAVQESILPNTLKLVLSSLLQGSAMSACLLFFTKLVQLHLPGLDFHPIFKVSSFLHLEVLGTNY